MTSAAAAGMLGALLAPVEDGLIELRPIGPGSRAGRPEFFAVSEYGRAAERAVELSAEFDAYFGVVPRLRAAGTKNAVGPAPAVWVDIDTPDAVAALDGFELQPSIVVASGSPGRFHAYWLLTELAEPDVAEGVNRALAGRLGSDECVVDAGRVMRLPGTLNHKCDPPAQVEVVKRSQRRFTVAELEAALQINDAGGGAVGRADRTGTDTSAPVQRVLDRLDRVRQTGTGWTALCPAHDDQSPSLVIAEGDDGRCLAHCFAGCPPEDVVGALGLELADLFPDDSPRKRRAASRLIVLAEHVGLDLFHTPAGVAHAAIDANGHRETWRVRAPEFELWLRKLHYEHTGEGVPGEVVNEAVATLEARAQFDGEEREVHRRVAGDGGRVVIDMGDPAWRAIEVTPEGWTVVDHPEVHFARDKTTLPLPEPVADGSLDELRAFTHCANERSFLLLVGSMAMCFHPSGPYPVAYPTGEQGSAKSTLSRAMVSVTDPRKAPLAMGNPTVRDLAAIANSVWVVGFDNVSKITPALSDALCQLVTGAGYRARELYTDGDAFSLELKRPVLLNGIGQAATRPDLLDRVALIELAPIAPAQRRTEDEFWADWDVARPRILGALLDGVASALANAGQVKLEGYPRLADFARWGEAAGLAWGWEPGAFAAAVESGREDLLEGSADAHPEIAALIELMEKRGGEAWHGSATELLRRLGDIADEAVTRSHSWPKRADTLSNRLVEHAPLLRQHGIEVERGREPGGKRKRFLRVTRERDAGTRRDA